MSNVDASTNSRLDPGLDYSRASEAWEEFRAITISNLPHWVDYRFLSSTPFAFEGRDFNGFRKVTADALDVEFHDIWCSGSAALGFSLNPDKGNTDEPKFFDLDSDLDIAIISPHYFERAWKDLREKYRQVEADPESDFKKALKMQRNRLFDGAIRADILLDHVSFAWEWNRGNRLMGSSIATQFGREVDVKYWIYRDVWSLKSYVAEGAKKRKGAF